MTDTTVQTTNAGVPGLLEPYAKAALTNLANVTDPTSTPYYGMQGYGQATGASPFAEFNPLQTQAAEGAAGLGTTPQVSQASDIAANVANKAMGYGGQNYYNAPQAQSMGLNYLSTQAPSLQNYQMQGPRDITTQDYTSANVSSYMSPYMQNVIDQQKNQAISDYARSIPGMGANAAKAGALGGTRNALVQSEAQRNLGNQLSNIQATGSQAAFQNAQQQFNAQQQANLQAQQANQQAGLATGQQNLNALLSTQQLGSQQGLQSQLANQSAALQNQQMGLNQLQNLNQYGLSNAQNQAQYGLAGANLGLQGLGLAGSTASTLGNLGMTDFYQQQQAANTQNQIGGGIQDYTNKVGLAKYQDWQNQMNYPLTAVQNMLSGLGRIPIQGGTTTTSSPSNTGANVGAAALGLGSLYAALFGGG